MNGAKVFADTKNMSREKWLGLRREGVGGSDASAIMGLNPYSSPLKVYLDKIGKLEEQPDSEAMKQGRDLEQYVAERFTEETGKKVKRCNKILQHPDYPFMLANVDRLIVGEDAGLECKTTSPYNKIRFDEGELSPVYHAQVQHYMAVTGMSKWYVAILVLGKAFHVFEVERNDDFIAALIDAEQDFWENHVGTRTPPLPIGNESDDEAISVLYPEGEDDAEVMDLDMDDELNLRALKVKQRDELDAEIKEIDQRCKLALGDFQRGMSAGWKVNWTNTSTSRVDTKLLKEKYPQIAEEVTKVTAGRRFSITAVKEAK